MKKQYTFILLFCLTALLVSSQTLDPTFGLGGQAGPFSYFSVSTFDKAMALQPDGKIVTVGYSYNGNNYDMAIMRVNDNGTIDNNFDGDGVKIIDVSGHNNFAYSVAVQPDGKIIIVGYKYYFITFSCGCSSWGGCSTCYNYYYDVVVVRLNPDGSFDNSFDGDGVRIIDITQQDIAHSVALQPDGKIIIGGYVSGGSLVIRVNSNGSLDGTFNGSGYVINNFASVIYSVAVQTDGKIVAGGYAYSANYDFAVARFNTNGSFDISFDGDGKKLIDFSNNSEDLAYTITSTSSGKIILAGRSHNFNNTSTYYDMAIVQLNNDGSLDNSFDDDGKVIIDNDNNYDEARCVIVNGDKILVSGYMSVTGDYPFAIIQLNNDGSMDNGFDNDGKYFYNVSGGTDISSTLIVQPDNKLLVGPYSNGSIVIIRLQLSDATTSVTCPENLITVADDGLCSAVVNNIDPAITPSNAGINYTIEKGGVIIESGTGSVSGKSFGLGVSTITYTAVDDEAISCSFTVTVNDNQVPIALCKNITVYLDENGVATVTAAQIDNGSSDNCGPVSLSVSPNSFNCSNLVGIGNGSQTFTSSGTFTVPPGVTSVRVLAIGGGGGGANGHQGGGGSGYVQSGTFNVIPGQNISVVVGSGGTGAISQSNNNDIVGLTAGTSSSFGALISANGGGVPGGVNQPGGNGGSGGGGSCNAGTLGGAGGTLGSNGSGCSYVGGTGQGNFSSLLTIFTNNTITGGAGGAGGTGTHAAGGGGGGILMNGTGSNGIDGIQSFSGKGGRGYGGGGGAGGFNATFNSLIRWAGGNGANGLVYVEWNNSGNPVTLTVTDNYLNTASCVANVTVIDNLLPIINCPANIAVDAPSNSCSASVPFAATATDNCLATIKYYLNYNTPEVLEINSGHVFAVGVQTVTAVATDPAGNDDECSFTITVNDATKPVFICPSNQNINLNATCQLVVPNLISGLTGTDNCGTVTFSQSPLAGSSLASSHDQTHNVVITASDGNGNTQTCTVMVTGKDVTRPTFICPNNQNVNLNATCQLVVPNLVGELTGMDNCGIVTFTQTPVAGSSLISSHNQTHNVLITASDGNGNTQTCTVVLTGKDVTKPAFTCPGNQNINLNANCQLLVPNLIAELTGSDNCGTVTFTQSPGAGASLPSSHNQTQNVVITASDGNGNTQTCTVVLTGNDVTKPTFTCPSNQNVNLNATCQLVVPDLITGLTGSDNCGTVTFTQSPLAGASLASSHNQTHNVLITASDGNGNTQTCTVVLTGKDVTKPTFTCPGNQNVNLNGTCQLIVPNLISGLTGNDNCGTVTFTQSPVAGASFGSSHNQTHNVVMTASDGNGNIESCTVVLTAKDITPPAITCPSAKTISCDASILPANTGSATGSDNCGGTPVITYSDVSGQDPDPSHAGHYNYTITRTWKATDIAYNTSTCNQTITVQDVTKPAITCPTDKLNVPFDFGQLYATIPIGSATATDNCATNANITIAGTRSDNVAITNQQYPLGQTTVSWSATDPGNNSSGCTQTITVRKRNTAVTYTGDMIDNKICVQYSDIISLQAKLTDNEGLVTPNNISGRNITFQLLSGTTVLRSKTATTNASGIALDTFKIEQAPGMYIVKAIFAGDNYFNGNYDQENCDVKQEDAIVEYNGSQYFTTSSSSTLTGSITLAAAINDIDDGNDKRGDIRKAKVTFKDGGASGSVLGSPNLTVGLVNPGVLTNGLAATTQTNITLNNNDASCGGKIFQVWVGASDHYTGADAGPTPVTLALPGQDFVTGGGHLVLTNSAGMYAGTANSKMNFGFTMKWNKSGKSLQGNINIVFRKWQLYNGVWQWRVYQVKSNAINSMAVVEVGANGSPTSPINPAVFRKAVINTKANLKDVTDPLNIIDLLGNHNLIMDAYDHITANGGVSDKITVTLMASTTNDLLFSSSWSSNATQAQTITGGDINVRNGTSGSITTKNTTQNSSAMEVIPNKENAFAVKVYPNPSQDQFTLIVKGDLNEKIEINLYDITGRKIQTLTAGANEMIRFGEKLKAGAYLAKVRQGNKQETVKLIKQ